MPTTYSKSEARLYSRSYASLEGFLEIADAQLAHASDRIGPFFGLQHVRNRSKIRDIQQAMIDEAVGTIAETFDPATVQIDEKRDGFGERHNIGVRHVDTSTDERVNPLYDQGLPNVFVRKSDGRSEVDLMYIPHPLGWGEGISIPPPNRPSVDFVEQEDGTFNLHLDYIHGETRAIDVLRLRQSERLARSISVIASKICAEELRPQLIVYSPGF